jgi:hypothetical protein
MHTSIVEINGNRYDTTTGQIINGKSANYKGKQVMDGFVQAAKAPTPKSSSQPDVNSFIPRHRQTARSSQLHKRADKAQTLMRNGLKKPTAHIQANFRKLSSSPSIERQLRAKLTPKHNRVDHFGNPIVYAKPLSPKPALRGEIVSTPRKHFSKASSGATAPLPSMVASASHQKLERLLDEALMQADSHREALRYHAARHFWQRRGFSNKQRIIALVAVLVLSVGALFFAWQKVPQVSVKVAGMQAHLHTSVPSYKPEGYIMAGPAKAVLGAVTVKYAATTNSAHSYDITQAQSNLTSSMIGQSLVPKGATVQTTQVAGNTIYIYGSKNHAAWVNNGVLYTIKDNADLRSDQLIKIVQGLNP